MDDKAPSIALPIPEGLDKIATTGARTPFPSAVSPYGQHDGGPGWRVQTHVSEFFADHRRRLMQVPLGDSHLAHVIRDHEMAHVRFSPVALPPRFAGVHPMITQIAEDLLVTQELQKRDLHVPDDCSECQSEYTRIYQALLESAEHFKIPEGFPREVFAAILLAVKTRGVSLGFSTYDGDPLGTYVALGDFHLPRPVNMAAYGFVKPIIVKLESLRQHGKPWNQRRAMVIEALLKLLPPEGDQSDQKKPDKRKPGESDNAEGRPNWRAMTVYEPDLAGDKPAMAKRIRVSDAGPALRRPDRAIIDGAIWANRQRVQGGSILLDASGSMGVTRDVIQKVAELVPMGLVAAYSTDSLYVLAKNGQVIAPADMPGFKGGNECDGLAVEWLIEQSGPLVWVTDFCVTEQDDGMSQRAIKFCMDLVNEHGIRVVGGYQELIEDPTAALQGGA